MALLPLRNVLETKMRSIRLADCVLADTAGFLIIERVGSQVRQDSVVRNRKYCTSVRDLVGLLKGAY